MMSSENLISLVYSRPELWDQTNMNYTSKNLKVKAWASIAEKLDASVDVAKARWTNLRDLFRRELKKTLKMVQETGDPNAHKPRWKHFKSLLFLKDQMVKDESASSLQFDESYSLYPQTILEDGSVVKFEEGSFAEEESSPGSSPSHQEEAILPYSSKKRSQETSEDQYQTSNKRHHWDVRSNGVMSVGNFEDCSSRSLNEMDEDYHFIMSILPSIRKVRQDRKTHFKMKVLQLIMEEENADSV